MSLYDDDDDIGGVDVAKTDEGWSRGVLQMKTKTSALAMQPSSMTSSMVKPQIAAMSPKFPAAAAAKPYISPLAAVGATSKPRAVMTTTTTTTSNVLMPAFGNNDRFGGNKKRAARHGLMGGKDRNGDKKLLPLGDPNWQVVNEYDPLWPNDYMKVVADMRDSKRNSASAADDENSSGKRRYTEGVRDKARERFRGEGDVGSSSSNSGFGRRPRGHDDYSDEEADDKDSRKSHRRSAGSTGGAAIAPPPSLTESSTPTPPPPPPPQHQQQDGESESSGQATKGGLGIAAKIMAKYGYKQGQGLGRTQQGMSQALAVEKTSKRGGRIVHENDFKKPPPMFGESFKTPPSLSQIQDEYNDDIPGSEEVDGDAGGQDVDEYGNPGMMPPPPPPMMGASAGDDGPKPSITDLMKNPSKVVLCKNMVGPGEVDDDLEPEVKEECNGKYGDVSKVVIFEMPNVAPEEAVRIFIEFKRVESAIKAVVDLNGRFFGGREVQARFYEQDRFTNLSLYD